MTDEQIKQNAEAYINERYKGAPLMVRNAFIAGAHSRDEEIERLKNEVSLYKFQFNDLAEMYEQQRKELDKLRSPWVTDRDPEIKCSISDAVLLLIDGLFYKVSRLERRKDGSEFWWGVDVANGEEVTAWMPIPELEKGE